MKQSTAPQSGYPIVFIHSGWSWYVAFSLYQARLSHPDTPIYLLTDTPKAYRGDFKVDDWADYDSGARQFQPLYRHMDSNPNISPSVASSAGSCCATG